MNSQLEQPSLEVPEHPEVHLDTWVNAQLKEFARCFGLDERHLNNPNLKILDISQSDDGLPELCRFMRKSAGIYQSRRPADESIPPDSAEADPLATVRGHLTADDNAFIAAHEVNTSQERLAYPDSFFDIVLRRLAPDEAPEKLEPYLRDLLRVSAEVHLYPMMSGADKQCDELFKKLSQEKLIDDIEHKVVREEYLEEGTEGARTVRHRTEGVVILRRWPGWFKKILENVRAQIDLSNRIMQQRIAAGPGGRDGDAGERGRLSMYRGALDELVEFGRQARTQAELRTLVEDKAAHYSIRSGEGTFWRELETQYFNGEQRPADG